MFTGACKVQSSYTKTDFVDSKTSQNRPISSITNFKFTIFQ